MSEAPAHRFDDRYEYELTVGADAIDAFGHVNNLVYLRWVLEAAERHSASRGWDWARFERARAAWIVRRHEVEYLRGAREGDSLRVRTWVEQYTRVTALRATEIVDAQGRAVCTCKTTWVFVALDTLRPTRIDPEFFRDFGGTLASGDRARRDDEGDGGGG